MCLSQQGLLKHEGDFMKNSLGEFFTLASVFPCAYLSSHLIVYFPVASKAIELEPAVHTLEPRIGLQ